VGLPRGRGDAGGSRACPVDVGRSGAVVGRHHLLRDGQRGALEVTAVRSAVWETKKRKRKGEGGRRCALMCFNVTIVSIGGGSQWG